MRCVKTGSTVVAAALGMLGGGLAFGEPLEVIYTKIPGNPTAAVPGAVDLDGNAAATDFKAIEDLFVSPDGSRWVVKGRTSLGSDMENILIVGSGRVGTGLVQEGNFIPGGGADERYEFFGSGVGNFDEMNRFAFSARARNMRTGSTNAANGQRVLLWDGVNITLRFKENDLISGLADIPANPQGDEKFGNSVGSIHLLNDGTIGSQDSTITGISTTRRPAIMYNSMGFHQTGVTNFLDIDSTVRTWATLTANAFYTTPDGAHWLAQGRGNDQASTGTVLVRDGMAVLKTGVMVPNSTVTVDAVFAFTQASKGSWFARGDEVGDNDWAVRDGAVVARTGDPITPGSTEHWGAVFNAFSGNCRGDWVLAGTTDNADAAANEVLVYNGTRVIVREGDPVDVNGDGMLNDDAFIGRGNNTLTAFEPNDLAITEGRMVYFFATLRNGAGVDLNSSPAFGTPQAFLRVQLVDTCPGDFNHSGAASVQDIFDFLTAYFGGSLAADYSNSCTLSVQDIFDFLSAYFGPCT